MWRLINSSIAEEIKIDCLSTRNIVLLICLDYVNKMESILIANSKTVAKLIVDFVKAQKDKIIKRQYSQDEELIYEFLRSEKIKSSVLLRSQFKKDLNL